MNRLKSGAVLAVPTADAAQAITPPQAREVITAQSADFGAYRQRLAGNTMPATPEGSARQSSGKVQAAVEDRKQAAATDTRSPDPQQGRRHFSAERRGRAPGQGAREGRRPRPGSPKLETERQEVRDGGQVGRGPCGRDTGHAAPTAGPRRLSGTACSRRAGDAAGIRRRPPLPAGTVGRLCTAPSSVPMPSAAPSTAPGCQRTDGRCRCVAGRAEAGRQRRRCRQARDAGQARGERDLHRLDDGRQPARPRRRRAPRRACWPASASTGSRSARRRTAARRRSSRAACSRIRSSARAAASASTRAMRPATRRR